MKNNTLIFQCCSLIIFTCLFLDASRADGESTIRQGRELAQARDKGNCIACHQMEEGKRSGDLGPPLVAMNQRYSNLSELYEQIADARKRNPVTIMPPFGTHGILTPEQLQMITEYVFSL